MQSFRQWIERELRVCREIVKGLPSGSMDRIKYDSRIAAYRKVLNEWVERGERP
jgi:hypothetical protein